MKIPVDLRISIISSLLVRKKSYEYLNNLKRWWGKKQRVTFSQNGRPKHSAENYNASTYNVLLKCISEYRKHLPHMPMYLYLKSWGCCFLAGLDSLHHLVVYGTVLHALSLSPHFENSVSFTTLFHARSLIL